MYFPAYNEPPVEVETPVAPPAQEPQRVYAVRAPQPPAAPPLHIEPQARQKPVKDKGERGAMAVMLILMLVLSGLFVLISLRWQYFAPTAGAFGYPGGGFIMPTMAPTTVSELERAPTGDGTVLDLSARDGAGALALQEIYKQVVPSVVAITVYTDRGYAEGTGVVMSADGYIITNAHVIEGGMTADVVLDDGRSFPALMVGKDTATDLAVLKIDAKNLTPAAFGSSDDMVVGDIVVAIGNPLGQELRGTMTDGILSAINRDMEVDGYQMTLLQTTAALNSGNSGGALVNDRGQVIGITNMKLVQRGFDAPVEGLGFAIPSTTTKTVVDALIATGHVTGRPVLGITVRPAYEAELTEAGADYGLMVNLVDEKSDAWTQGIRAGDIVLEANGIPLHQNQDLLDIKTPLSAGDTIAMKLFRGGETLEVTIKLVEQYTINGD